MFHRKHYAEACRKSLEGYVLSENIGLDRWGNVMPRAWKREEAERLLELCREGYRSFEISKKLNRSPKAIQKAFRRFGFPALHNVYPRRGCDNSQWKGGIHIGKNGYLYFRRPHHPHANHAGYVLAHRLVVEEHLGRYLLPTEVVHHKDGNPANNDISNLEVFSSNGQHLRATLKGVRHNMTPEGRKKLSELSRNRWRLHREGKKVMRVGRRPSTHSKTASLEK